MRNLPLRRVLFWSSVPLLAGAAVLASARGGTMQQRSDSPCQLPDTLDGSVGSEIYCSPLVPVPALRHARAVLELTAPSSPFGAAVSADGIARYEAAIVIEGLPRADALGAYHAYIAWAYTLTQDEPIRLGRVDNGRTVVASTPRNQFRVVVTAEASPDATQPAGREILRGTSPSARLLSHRDMIRMSTPGFGRDMGAHMQGMSGWSMPPMDPGMPSMPGLDALLPDVEPWLPHADSAPFVEPSRVVRLASGDTLRLEAGLVRRRVGQRTLTMYAFNRQQPGPLIRVDEGATIIVAFHNALDRPSSVHWHGVRLENRYDGVVGVTQEAVPPGGSFVYHVHFRDAGIYWYHPHVREDIEQDLGLYGNMLVQPALAGAYGPAHREEVVTLDDFLMGDSGPVPYGDDAPTHTLMGRFGNVFLINGELRYTLTVQRGEVVRFYFTNVANSRIFNISFADAPMKIVGGDVSRYEREAWVPSVVLAPAERAIVDVMFPQSGEVALSNRIQAVNHMLGTFTPEVDTLGVVTVRQTPASPDYASAFRQLRVNSDVISEIDRFRSYIARPPDKTLILRMDASRLSGALLSTLLVGYAPPVDWNDGMPMMNWLMTAQDARWTLQDPATGRENMDIDWHFRVGQVVKIALVNPAGTFHPMSHPIHLHGQRFLVVKRNGVLNPDLVWKDTVIVPVGETVEILLELSNPGRWMLHCHIAEHLGAGMMMTFDVQS